MQSIKIKKLIPAYILFVWIFFPFLPATAAKIATQDLFIVSDIRVSSGGGTISLTDDLLSKSMGSPGTAVTLPGGVTFTPTAAFKALAVDVDRRILDNTSVMPGILKFGNNNFFSVVTSPDLEKKAETIGISDALRVDLTSVFPSDVKIGDVGRMDYSFMQFTAPIDYSRENTLTPLQILQSRAENGLISIPSHDNQNMSEVFNFPFIVAEGSSAWTYFGKGLSTVGLATGGTLAGAVAGSVVPGIGTTAGAITGGIGGFLVGLGGAIERNSTGDNTPDPMPPSNILPSPLAPVPEPQTYAMMLAGLGLLIFIARRQRLLKQRLILSHRGRMSFVAFSFFVA